MLTGFSRASSGMWVGPEADASGRTGEWDETTDGPALGQAVFRVCKVSTT